MYKEKKISKFALICFSFLIAISSMLAINPSWINNFYGETLCSSSSAPTITLDNFDTTTTDYLSSYDFYITTVTYVTSVSGFTSIGPCFHFAFYYINDSTIGNGGFTYTTSNVTIYTKTLNTYTGSYNLTTNSYSGVNGIQAFGQKGGLFVPITSIGFPSIIVFTYNNNYYTAITSDLYYSALVEPSGPTYDDGYNAGYTAGYDGGQLVGYSNGVTAGINQVLNNPNQYGLYTQEQYNLNYDNGYRIGQEDIDADPNSYGYHTDAQYQLNYVRGYDEGRIVGIDTVLNNPSRYDLYTLEQMDARYDTGYTDGETVGYADGYSNGDDDGISRDISFKNLIYAVVDVPVETVRSLFNFDLLGFNLFNLFTALFTLMFLIILIKFFMRSK